MVAGLPEAIEIFRYPDDFVSFFDLSFLHGTQILVIIHGGCIMTTTKGFLHFSIVFITFCMCWLIFACFHYFSYIWCFKGFVIFLTFSNIIFNIFDSCCSFFNFCLWFSEFSWNSDDFGALHRFGGPHFPRIQGPGMGTKPRFSSPHLSTGPKAPSPGA